MFIAIDKVVVLKSEIRCVTCNAKSMRIYFTDGTLENKIYSSEEECKQEFEKLKHELLSKTEIEVKIID